MNSKDGRKKAVDRIKHHEKEKAELDKRKEGLEIIMSYYRNQPEIFRGAKVDKDINDQLKVAEGRIDAIAIKIHKLQTYIANADGSKPPPDLPAHLKNMATDASINSWIEFQMPVIPTAQNNSWGSPHMQKKTKSASSLAEDVFTAKVIYDFEAAPNSEEMPVKAGDMVTITETNADGWWKAALNGRTGYIPSYVIFLIILIVHIVRRLKKAKK
jgi:hypothetical protein